MYLVIHTSLRSPVLAILLGLALFVAFNLLWTGWTGKRRGHQLPPPLPNPAAHAAGGRTPGLLSRSGRSPFVWPGLICLATTLILANPQKSPQLVRARTVPNEVVPGFDFDDALVSAGNRHYWAVSLWYTNDPPPDGGQLSSFDLSRISLWRVESPKESPVQIVVSTPIQPVADPDLPVSVDWDVLSTIRPDRSEIPQPPLRLTMPLR